MYVLVTVVVLVGLGSRYLESVPVTGLNGDGASKLLPFVCSVSHNLVPATQKTCARPPLLHFGLDS